MKSAAALLLLASVADAFVPSISSARRCVTLSAKHANNKAAKKAAHNRPRKSRPSDINRKPPNYPTVVSPPEYTIINEIVDKSTSEDPEDELPIAQIVQSKTPGIAYMMIGDEHVGWCLGGEDLQSEDAEIAEYGPEFLQMMEGDDDNESQDEDSDNSFSVEDLGLPEDAEIVEFEYGKQLVF